MNKIWFLSILFLVSLIILGCQNVAQSTIIDCGTDTICFSKNFRTCTPSKIYGGATLIKRGTPQACEIYFESAENKLAGLEKMSMVCTLKDTASYTDYEMNAYDVFLKSDCQGSLADTYAKIVKTSQDALNQKTS